MTDALRSRVIRIAHANPELRPLLLPLLEKRVAGEVVNGYTIAPGEDLSRTDLSRMDLSGADLSGANLTRADFLHSDLSGASLTGANLESAILGEANFEGADLSRARMVEADMYMTVLSRAKLRGADLSRAEMDRVDLKGADLSGAKLSHANLFDANFSRANLSGANLSGANLSGAVFSGANLSGANLNGASRSEDTDSPIPGWDLVNGKLKASRFVSAGGARVKLIETQVHRKGVFAKAFVWVPSSEVPLDDDQRSEVLTRKYGDDLITAVVPAIDPNELEEAGYDFDGVEPEYELSRNRLGSPVWSEESLRGGSVGFLVQYLVVPS